MGNHYSHITKDHLIFLDLIGEELARKLIQELGPIRISLYLINEHLNQKEIAKSLKSNKPVKQIAKEVGVHKTTVYRFQKKMRVKK
jgi:DNA invertase Pin-like site-specific DNA recombinase